LSEREWREASDLRMSRVGLAAVLATAAILRFWALGHGIPHSVQVDEPEIVERAFNMMRSGSLNPRGFFDYPGLYLYVQFVVSCARFIYGAIGGEWTSLAAASTPSFYLWGRAVSACFGVATVFLVFQIGLRWGGRHGLLAAAIMAVMPLHVRYSHYVLTDAPLTFFVTLTLLLSLIAHERNRAWVFAMAGVAAGLAAATKYNGGLALVMPLVACWMTVPARPSRTINALAIVGGAMVGFIVAAPYTILDLPGFLNAFARLSSEYRRGVPPAEPPWSVYLKHLRMNLGLPALLMALAGAIMGLVRVVRGPGRIRWAVLLVFPLLYFWLISHQQIVFGRYLLPLVPMLCVLAAAAVISGVSLLRRYEIPRAPRSALIVALTVLALLPPALTAIAWTRDASRDWTSELAYNWAVANLPEGSRIVMESRELLLPPDRFESRNVSQIRMRKYEEYVADGVDYLIASSQVNGRFLERPQQYPREYADYMTLFAQSRELVRFAPSAEHPGPELRILKVRP
jgi:4-amino-4-deoxy-L-arabinose transferase-like glycosyltransferase